MSWDAGLYLRYGAERTRPSVELVSRIALDTPASIVDIGCGPGNSTAVLRERWPGARVVGLDSSPQMIDAAREAAPHGDWVLADAATWTASEPVDLVFSNAALQWLPDHIALVQRLFAQVAEGGALAFQIPSNAYAPIRVLLAQVAADDAWSDRMQGALSALTMHEPSFYYDALATAASGIDLWETEYQHVMDSPQAIVEWISSTGARPFLAELDSEAERSRFLQMLAERTAATYEPRADGRVLFGFKRLFVIAYR